MKYPLIVPTNIRKSIAVYLIITGSHVFIVGAINNLKINEKEKEKQTDLAEMSAGLEWTSSFYQLCVPVPPRPLH